MKVKLPFLASVLIAAALLGNGCKTTPDDTKPNQSATTADKKKPPVPTIADQNGDKNFQAFVSRLRKAVHAHDMQTIAGMMTKDFGYRIDPVGEGAGVFAFWDENNLWPELELVLNEHFVPNEDYMVAPAEFLTNQANFTGYRAGIRLENGAWKFAYFVAG